MNVTPSIRDHGGSSNNNHACTPSTIVLVVDKLRRSVADEMCPYRRQRHRGLHLTVLVIIFNLLKIPRGERDLGASAVLT